MASSCSQDGSHSAFHHKVGHVIIYISCEEDRLAVSRGRHVLGLLEQEQYNCILRDRDTIPGSCRYEDARELIPRCTLLVCLMDKNFLTDPYMWSQYEIALGIDYNRDIILVPTCKIKVPKLFSKLPKSSLFDSSRKFHSSFLHLVHSAVTKRNTTGPLVKCDLIKEFIWTRERSYYQDLAVSNMMVTRGYIHENRILRNRIHELIELRASESAALFDQNRNLQMEIQRGMTERKSVDQTKLENMEMKKQIGELKFQLKTSRKKMEEFMLRTEVEIAPPAPQTPVDFVENTIYKMLLDFTLKSQSNMSDETESCRFGRTPSDVKALCKRYQGIIAPDQILSCGRRLQLDTHRLNKVASFEQYGTEEMFCQLIHEYFKASNGYISMNKLLDSLRESGINLEGKPMPDCDRNVLDRNIKYLSENIVDITIINICLIQRGFMSLTTAQYILHTQTSPDRLLRLIEYLRTRQTGFGELVQALEEVSLEHVAQQLKGDISRQQPSNVGPLENEETKKSCWPRGRVLGGSSCLNYMVYVRGSRHDFDDWAANGCEGWSYKDVLPYFIKSENVQIPELRNSDYHGTDGPLHVSASYATPLTDIHGEAMAELGFKTTDCNGEDMFGYSKIQLTTQNGIRCSTAKAFLREAMSRPNLHVTINSVVTKVLIENKKAVGIELIKDGKRHVIMCKKEVILSAGAVGSPQILMLSGVGPEKHLKEHGIPVHADLPVGENLQDHLMVALPFFPNQSLSITQAKAASLKSFFSWLFLGKGCWTFSGLESTAFVKTKKDVPYKYPDMQLHFLSTSPAKGQFDEALTKFNLDRKVAETLVSTEIFDKERFTILPTLLHPKSRGVIKLRSSDPMEHPIIDPNYLSEQEDVDSLVRGIKLALQMSNTSAFKKYGVDDSHPDMKHAALEKFKYGTDEFWEEYVRHLALTVYHPTSTCAMGSEDDPNAVVDQCLRVRGIENLRIADCSVMRTITSGNTNAPAIMIGEKAADLILQRDSVKDIKQRIKHVLDKL